MALRLYNTMTRQKEDFVPLVPGKAGMYTCGPTVYACAHIGNFRAYIFEDLLHRVLRYCGYAVTQIMNLTDVDDKTIRNSIERGASLFDYTAVYKKAFFEDLQTLNITPAAVYPEATAHIPEMIAIIQTLLDKGAAYERDGSVYFSIAKFPAYGRLAHLDYEGLRAGASGRVDNDEYDKDSVNDFVLWKGYSEKDKDVVWDSPFGRGRPGWHIECSAMSMKYLGETMDIHTGGVDNIFPHHENEIAQSEAATGKPFVRCWLHCEHLVVDGEKMSKSKGNFYTLRDLLAKPYSARAIRYLLLTTHYRKMLNFSEVTLKAAEASLARLDTFALDVERCARENNTAGSGGVASLISECERDFRASLEDDLNISEAMAALFTLLPKIRELFPLSPEAAKETLAFLDRCNEVLGFLGIQPQTLESEVQEMIERRNAARREKNFAESDRIRDELARRGITLKDTKDGTIWERRS
jgi:cysteinyl-tRNA synthetase